MANKKTTKKTKDNVIPKKIEAAKKSASQIDPEIIAKGAAVVSIAAGVVAAGAMMSKKENRKKAGEAMAKGAKMAQELAKEIGDEAQERYQAVQMTVTPKSRSSSSKKRRSTKA